MRSKKLLSIVIILLIIIICSSSSIDANIGNAFVDSDSTDFHSEDYEMDNENSHLICFVESGYVRHKNVDCKGFYFTAPFRYPTYVD